MKFNSNDNAPVEFPRIDSKEDFDKVIRIEIASFLKRHPDISVEEARTNDEAFQELFTKLAIIYGLKDEYLTKMLKEVLDEYEV